METYAFIAVLANKRDNETVKFEKEAKQSQGGVWGKSAKGYKELKWHSQVLYSSLCVRSETNEMHFREVLLLLLLPQEPGRLVKVSTLSRIVRALFMTSAE